jgi:hypothetical protein
MTNQIIVTIQMLIQKKMLQFSSFLISLFSTHQIVHITLMEHMNNANTGLNLY